ncbi:MAG: hypothetical protein WC718_18945 [Phycisphaerales bacterium]|jgi:hypothetical protein
MARPTKYTPETIAKLEEAIALGATYVLACGHAGITFETFSQWREHKVGFSDRIKAAEARGALGWLAKIEKAANDDNWQAAAWKLERRYPHDYGRIVQTKEVSGPDGKEIVFRVVHE